MIRRLLYCVVSFYCHLGLASTFVGNGGNAGELDLNMAIATISDVAKKLETAQDSLCRCASNFPRHDFCQILGRLDANQKEYCAKILSKSTQSLQVLSSRSSELKYRWSDDELNLYEKDGKKRRVDAIAQANEKVIILDRQRFQDMSAYHRQALLVHEIFHFIEIDGKEFSDEERVGPFSDGKSLRDALGAAIVVASIESGRSDRYAHLESISRADRHIWASLNIISLSRQNFDEGQLLVPKSTFGLEYQLGINIGDFSIHGLYEDSNYEGKIERMFSVSERKKLNSLGVGYNFYPFNPRALSRWTEFHLNLTFMGVSGTAEYTVSDRLVALKDDAKVSGFQLRINSHLPLSNGFWINSSCGARNSSYQYKKVDAKVNLTEVTLTFGVGYGF